MNEELTFDNILDDDSVESLFSSYDDSKEENQSDDSTEIENKEDDESAEIDPEQIFGESESVGSDNEDKKADKDTSHSEGSSQNFYSSIADALQEDGILEGLEFDSSSIQSAEDFAELIQKVADNRLDASQKRINEALNANVEPTVIKQYEDTIKFLDDITESSLSAHSEEAENLRKNLIYRDLLNRGYTEKQAVQKVQRSLDAGTDVEDAIDALASNKDFYNKAYQSEIEAGNKKAKEAQEAETKRLESLKKSILEDEKFYGDITVDKNTRRKIYDNIAKATYKDPDSGKLLTEVQKYQLKNPDEFIKNVGLLYTLTDGFKSLDKLIKPQVNKQIKKGLRNLENTINSTARDSSGNLKFVRGNDDSNSYFGKGWSLEI